MRALGPFTFAIDDAFALSNGATVLVGRVVAGSPSLLAPCEVELFVDDESRGMIRLDAEQLPHPRSPDRRAVETRSVSAADLRGRACCLEHRARSP
jgi:hypothetical protein